MQRRLAVHIFWGPHPTPSFFASGFGLSCLVIDPKFGTLSAKIHIRKLYYLSCQKIAYFIAFIFRAECCLFVCNWKTDISDVLCVTCFDHLISTLIDSNIDRGSTVLWEQSMWAERKRQKSHSALQPISATHAPRSVPALRPPALRSAQLHRFFCNPTFRQ